KKLHFQHAFINLPIDRLEKFQLFSKFIRDNKTLKEINLCEDHFSDEEANFLVDAFQNNQTLTSIGFPFIPFKTQQLLLEAFNKNTSLISASFPYGYHGLLSEFSNQMTMIAEVNKQRATELLGKLVNPKCTLSPEEHHEIPTRKAAIKATLMEGKYPFPIHRYKALVLHINHYEKYMADYRDNPIKTTGIAKNEPIHCHIPTPSVPSFMSLPHEIQQLIFTYVSPNQILHPTPQDSRQKPLNSSINNNNATSQGQRTVYGTHSANIIEQQRNSTKQGRLQ
ncbi:MAG: hypothetical protein ACK4M7_08460, partial [Burkholderiales bacterium]